MPLVLSMFGPESVLDVGCGDGTWLRTFAENGVREIRGVDGSYVPAELLQIPREQFLAHDLSTPLNLERQFDLVMSLEVAEHLPEAVAKQFVHSLVRHGNLVLFSASIPGQFGEHHVNEQWPSYWVHLFQAHGYRPFDVLRWKIWSDRSISWWYRQNLMVFATPERAARIPALSNGRAQDAGFPLDVAHPDFMNHFRDTLRTEASVRLLTRKLAGVIKRRIREAVAGKTR